jgi:HlyD family secretion protein
MKMLRIALLLFSLPLLWACGSKDASLRGSGTIESVTVRVAAKTAGELLEILVEEGSRVEKGDLMARIDHTRVDIQLRQAQAGVELAEAQLALVLQGARGEDIRQAEESLTQAEDTLRLAQEDFQRMETLFAGGSVTRKQRDEAESRLTGARTRSNSAAAALSKLQNLARPEEILAARARLKQSEAAVEMLEQEVLDSSVRAPVPGYVTQQLIETGELAGPGLPLFTISELSRVYLTIYVPEADLARVRLGQAAAVSGDAEEERSLPGRVIYISPLAEFTPKNIQTKEERVKQVFAVKIAVDNPNQFFKPGLPADAVLVEDPGAVEGTAR